MRSIGRLIKSRVGGRAEERHSAKARAQHTGALGKRAPWPRQCGGAARHAQACVRTRMGAQHLHELAQKQVHIGRRDQIGYRPTPQAIFVQALLRQAFVVLDQA